LGRVWVIASLGRRWTTRLIVRPGTALVTSGPYRLLSHPNYLIVIGELAILPLAFDALVIAVGFSACNAVMLLRRVRLERAALGSGTDFRALLS
jgi:methyltransferase